MSSVFTPFSLNVDAVVAVEEIISRNCFLAVAADLVRYSNVMLKLGLSPLPKSYSNKDYVFGKSISKLFTTSCCYEHMLGAVQ